VALVPKTPHENVGAARTLKILCIGQMVMLSLFSFLPMPVVILAVMGLVWSSFGWSFMAAQQTRLVLQIPSASPPSSPSTQPQSTSAHRSAPSSAVRC
jgi:predicted MFS family arabinose efflux permease